jgi:hypothetical protein
VIIAGVKTARDAVGETADVGEGLVAARAAVAANEDKFAPREVGYGGAFFSRGGGHARPDPGHGDHGPG